MSSENINYNQSFMRCVTKQKTEELPFLWKYLCNIPRLKVSKYLNSEVFQYETIGLVCHFSTLRHFSTLHELKIHSPKAIYVHILAFLDQKL